MGDMLEIAEERAAQPPDRDVGQLDPDGSRFGLGQIEDAVQKTQQIPAGTEDDARILDLGVGHGSARVVLQLLREDQEAVQRGAQLVRHVGDELGLVLRRDGQLAGLLLDQELGLLDLSILCLRLDVLLGKEAGLSSKILVRLA